MADFGLKWKRGLSTQGYFCLLAPERFSFCFNEEESEPLTDKADVYSFGMILWEMLMQQSLHDFVLNQEQSNSGMDPNPEELYIDGCEALSTFTASADTIHLQLGIMERVKGEGYRPWIPSECKTECPEYVALMESCWSQDPSLRPSFHRISQILHGMKEFFFCPHSDESLLRLATTPSNGCIQFHSVCSLRRRLVSLELKTQKLLIDELFKMFNSTRSNQMAEELLLWICRYWIESGLSKQLLKRVVEGTASKDEEDSFFCTISSQELDEHFSALREQYNFQELSQSTELVIND